jgi:cytochrome c-type biogenesis protein CcmH
MRAVRWAILALIASFAGQRVGESPAGGALLAAHIAQTPDSVLEAHVRAVASELRCPVCQGESIQDSPAALAQQMRAVVREQLAAGRTPGEVKAYFVDKYGEWILLRPRARGWNMLVYVLPMAALLIGAAVVARAARHWASRGEAKAADEVQPTTAESS